MAGRLHIIGAGIAGLAAALAGLAREQAVSLHEAAPQAGGRCRTVEGVDGFTHDNGTHVLFTANRRALALIERVGARADWIEPEPDGFPVFDAERRHLTRVGLSPLSWLRAEHRPQGLTPGALARLLRLALPLRDRPVAEVVGDGPLLRHLVEPLTVAVLNTPVTEASSKRLGIALRRLMMPGAARLLIARDGLSANLVEPALAAIRAQGGNIALGERLREIRQDGERVTALVFASRVLVLEPEDAVVLAVPPFEAARLLPGLEAPQAHEPILNLHYHFAGPAAPRFIGFVGTLAQWALLRADHLSVTVSAAGDTMESDGESLRRRIWAEIAPALQSLGFAAQAENPPEARIVREKRATIRQAAGPLPQPPVRPLANLALAGDWFGSLPATIESAVEAGERAAAALADIAPAPLAHPTMMPLGGSA